MPASNVDATPPPFCGGPASLYHYTSPPLTEHATHDTIPLVPGLMVTTAIAKPEGDYESFKTVVGQSPDGLDLLYQADIPKRLDTATQQFITREYSARFVFTDDQQSACAYAAWFRATATQPPPDTLGGATAITISAAMLAALEAGKNEYLQLMIGHYGTMDYADSGVWLHLASPHPVPFPVILNDQPATLPAMKAVCNADSLNMKTDQGNVSVVVDTPCEFLVLDDPTNPLVLEWQFKALGTPQNGTWRLDTTAHLRVIKIGYLSLASPGQGGKGGGAGGGGGGRGGGGAVVGGAGAGAGRAQQEEAQMETALAAHKKVLVYGIYFDFAKATIKKESDPVLHEIADLMHKNPTWTLAINGYTDSIGGDAYNLDLSKRRAAAVKDTLVTGYHLTATRLATAGYGAASPVDSNSTLEGRARNRRVELIRQ
jgi:outer membrane protein OmpA-like peptidoglycan-associated protein